MDVEDVEEEGEDERLRGSCGMEGFGEGDDGGELEGWDAVNSFGVGNVEACAVCGFRH